VRKENRDQINYIDDEVDVVLRDHLKINQAIVDVLEKHSSIAIAEDFEAYKAAKFDQRLGKLLLVDQAEY
jgi:hypothetical protein